MCWILICKPNKKGGRSGVVQHVEHTFRNCCVALLFLFVLSMHLFRPGVASNWTTCTTRGNKRGRDSLQRVFCRPFGWTVSLSHCRSVVLCVCGCKVPAEKQKSGSNLFKLPAGKENKHSAVQWIQQTVKQLTCPWTINHFRVHSARGGGKAVGRRSNVLAVVSAISGHGHWPSATCTVARALHCTALASAEGINVLSLRLVFRWNWNRNYLDGKI